MATIAERVSVLETQVTNLDDKLDDIKDDVSTVQYCVDRNRTDLMAAITKMQEESNTQHKTLSDKISNLEKLRDKYTYIIAGAIGAGGFLMGHMGLIEKLFK